MNYFTKKMQFFYCKLETSILFFAASIYKQHLISVSTPVAEKFNHLLSFKIKSLKILNRPIKIWIDFLILLFTNII